MSIEDQPSLPECDCPGGPEECCNIDCAAHGGLVVLTEATKRTMRDFGDVIDAFALACLSDGEEMARGERDGGEASDAVKETRAALEDAITADREGRPVDWALISTAEAEALGTLLAHVHRHKDWFGEDDMLEREGSLLNGLLHRIGMPHGWQPDEARRVGRLALLAMSEDE